MNCENLQFPVCLDAILYTMAERYQHLKKCEFCQKVVDEMFPKFENVTKIKFKE